MGGARERREKENRRDIGCDLLCFVMGSWISGRVGIETVGFAWDIYIDGKDRLQHADLV